MRESEKKKLRELIACEHSNNGLLCSVCKYDPRAYLSKGYNFDLVKLKGLSERDWEVVK